VFSGIRRITVLPYYFSFICTIVLLSWTIFEERSIMSHHTGPSMPAAAITAIDEKLADDIDTSVSSTTLTPDSHSTGRSTPAEAGSIPYWLVNVPRAQWPMACPDFLRDLSEKNIQVLSTPDAAYPRQSWETVKEIIS
jgi:hypothetical protein